jgi:hypothetical protein
MSVIHTIISWDCCFRNFFHLVGSLAEQNYPKDKYEMIFVEQRDREASNAYNHNLGLRSLQDTVDAYRSRFNVRAVFLSRDYGHPYHLGICNNVGIRQARGEYISVMDGDILVRPDFLTRLEEAHHSLDTVINLDRWDAARPVGAAFENWTDGIVDFDLCHAVCPDLDRKTPRHVTNKGPLISAPKKWWEAVGGYDEHRIWSTGISRLGQDVTARMEVYAGRESRALPKQFCVHPYHPSGFNRTGHLESFVLSAQQQLILWSQENAEPSREKRNPLSESLYLKYQWAVEGNITGKLAKVDLIRLELLMLISKSKKGVKRFC